MTPTALKRKRLFTISSVGNGRNHLRRTSPTLWPSLRSRRIATFIGSASVPWPKTTYSASSVMYSSRNGLSPPRPNSFLKSAWASLTTSCGLRPREEPAEVADGERVVVLGPKRAGVVERAVPADRDHRKAKAGGHRDRLEGVEPAYAGASDEHA